MARVVHFEIQAGDPARAVAFYQAVFDWQIWKWNGPVDYWLITTGPDSEPGINGALHPRQGEVDGQAVIAYVCTVEVSSIDATLEKVVANSGEIVVAKHLIAGIGWHAYCKDTEGNIFGLSQMDREAVA